MEISPDSCEDSIGIESNSIEEILKKLNNPFHLPDYLIQLLNFNGFDNFTSLSMFVNEDFEKLEDFAKRVLSKLLDDEEKKKFFSLFARNIDLFKIVEVHRRLIMAFVEKCKDYLQNEKCKDLGKNIAKQKSSQKRQNERKTNNSTSNQHKKKLINNNTTSIANLNISTVTQETSTVEEENGIARDSAYVPTNDTSEEILENSVEHIKKNCNKISDQIFKFIG